MRKGTGSEPSPDWFFRVLLLAVVGYAAFPSRARAELKLVEVRPTYGRLGSTRPNTKVLPGEDLFVEFVVSGFDKGNDGRPEVSLSAELVDAQETVVARVPTARARVQLALGGDAFAGHVHFGLPLDFSPGKFMVRGNLTDIRSGEKAVVEQMFEVTPLDFGLVRLRLAGDAGGVTPIGGNLTVGQEVFVLARGVGFARKAKAIHVVGTLTIRGQPGKDESGKPNAPVPITVAFEKEVDDDQNHLDYRWTINVNRPGKFIAQIEVRDEISGKHAAYELPLAVSPAPALDQPAER